eukprot:gnl/TRDRNA2_/TRDRNA2_81217_c0_seq1.p1 gnl/TRDRNA2_/TRDRNA2_81217_c0~~gnl/TRDRNA2_/TRDRNA2_81217_c0_seq1.p1  ORF type:complete len:177 (+),score=26.10 gnl/TRDRNA2_/TRDRNA2_81217_c0_seq1:269-799(+)
MKPADHFGTNKTKDPPHICTEHSGPWTPLAVGKASPGWGESCKKHHTITGRASEYFPCAGDLKCRKVAPRDWKCLKDKASIVHDANDPNAEKNQCQSSSECSNPERNVCILQAVIGHPKHTCMRLGYTADNQPKNFHGSYMDKSKAQLGRTGDFIRDGEFAPGGMFHCRENVAYVM